MPLAGSAPPPGRETPGPGQESVWDYPRPPRVEATPRRLEVWFAGERVAATREALRVLETSQAPAYYFPPGDVRRDLLRPAAGRATRCEWKGRAEHFDLQVGSRTSEAAAWAYPAPSRGFEALAGRLAFYPARVDRCLVDGEEAQPMPGGFYGGWVTRDLAGPLKGAPGTEVW